MPETIDIKQEELDALLERVRLNHLQEGDYELIKALVETVSYLSSLSDEKAASIKRLLKMLFGSKTEKAKKKNTDALPKPGKPKKKKKGHGRNGVNAYKGAKKVKVSHETLKSGNDCPACEKGKLYGEKPPARIVRITGGAPFQATVYELQRLRCNLCGQIFAAQAPDHVGKDKYDAKSGAMLALLKYGSGVPLYRLGKLQASLGMPLPPSTQWEIIESVAEKRVVLQNRARSLYRRPVHEPDSHLQLAGSKPALQEHSSEIFQTPSDWLPWTFERTIGQKSQQTADNPQNAS